MAYNDKVNATQLTTLSNVIQWFDSLIKPNPGEQVHVEIEYDPVSTPTDDLSFHIRRTLDDTSENWDDEDYQSGTIPNGNDPNKISFDLAGGFKYRIGVQSTGATDDHTSADMSYRKDGIDA